MGVGAAVLVLRAVVLPWLLARALAAEPHEQREATPLVNTASLAADHRRADRRRVRDRAVRWSNWSRRPRPARCRLRLAVVLIALFVMTTRRHAVSQAAGFLMLDNGIAATAFLLTAGVPLIVELGASLDVLFAVIVIGVLTGRLRRAFGGADLDQLQELRD